MTAPKDVHFERIRFVLQKRKEAGSLTAFRITLTPDSYIVKLELHHLALSHEFLENDLRDAVDASQLIANETGRLTSELKTRLDYDRRDVWEPPEKCPIGHFLVEWDQLPSTLELIRGELFDVRVCKGGNSGLCGERVMMRLPGPGALLTATCGELVHWQQLLREEHGPHDLHALVSHLQVARAELSNAIESIGRVIVTRVAASAADLERRR